MAEEGSNFVGDCRLEHTHHVVSVTSTSNTVSYLLPTINSFEWVNSVRTAARPPAFWGLVALLFLELVAVSIAAVVLVIDLLVLEPMSWGSAVALTVLVILAAVWMAATIVGLLRGQSWVRASATVWQVLQFAIGMGALQGPTAQPAWGWPIIIVSLVTFAVLFAKPVVAATQKRGDERA